MPSRKTKSTAAINASAKGQTGAHLESPSDSLFPFARYTSVVGVHTSLLAFSALLLPITPTSLLYKGLALISSTDGGERPRRNIVQLLTENPARTVAWICAGALILQGWWASWMRTSSLEMRSDSRQKDGATSHSAEVTKQKLERRDFGNQRVVAFCKAAALTAAASVVFHVVTVLFGAPLTRHVLRTYLSSLLLAILTVLPPAHTLGLPSLGSDSPSLVSRLTWIRLFAELSPRTPFERALVYPAVGAVLGCWAGAIPIGLDWERPWQAWPLTPAFGAVGGYIAGSLAALAVSAVLAFAQVDRAAQATAGKAKRA
ncbi:GPI biosynthesis protein family Pig-F-domain-containing protein [Trametes elegans]|nr:GPI biosynthesis protein family Pig-F-domain-containing protein [Trametes elegans]